MLTFTRSRIAYFIVLISLFFFIYAPRINFAVPVNLSIVVFLVFILWNYSILFKSLYIQSYSLIFWFFLTFYNLIIASFYGHDYTFFSKISASVPSYLIFGSILYYVVKKYNFFSEINPFIYLLKVFLYIILGNSVIIFSEFIFPEFKSFLESILFNDFNNLNIIHYADHPFILRGFSSAAGAGQSLFSSLGVLIVFYFYYRKIFSLGRTFLFFLILFLAQIFLGRIGIIYSLIFFILFSTHLIIELGIKSIIFKIRTILQIVIVILILFFAVDFINLDTDVIKWSFDWFDLNDGIVENSTSKEITDNYFFLPNNITHLLFGVGFFDGISKIYGRSDVGYVKTIFSCGILLGSILYLQIFFKLVEFSRKINGSRMFFYLLIFLFFSAEFKEPFMYQNFAGRALFLIFGFLGAFFYDSSISHKP
jgi:hypothetical protein